MTLRERIDKRTEQLNKRFKLDNELEDKFELAMSYVNNGEFEKANEVFASMDEIYEQIRELNREFEELEATKVEEDNKQDAEELPYEVMIEGKVIAAFDNKENAKMFSHFWIAGSFYRWALTVGYKTPNMAELMTEKVLETVPIDEGYEVMKHIEEKVKVRQKNS